MSKLAMIIARGGSKRIPRKNIKPFFKKPIIAYSIEAAIQANLFDEVMVSTDDDEIAEIAIKCGAKVPFKRSSKNASNHSTTVDVILEVLDSYKKNGKQFEYACCLYPTAPFVTPEILNLAFNRLHKEKLDTIFPALQYSFPIQRAIKINEQKLIELYEPEHVNTRSQDLEPTYHDAGQFYWMNVLSIEKEKKLWTENTGVLVIDEMHAQDIDSEKDWEIAEFKYKLLIGGKA